MKTKGRLLLIITFIYIYVPVFLFLAGWTKWWIALITTGIVLFGLYHLIKDYGADHDTQPDIIITIPAVCISLSVIAIICILLGLGGVYPQAGDWYKHNSVLIDLINNKWPVYYYQYDKCMLTYYLGQYLVPAVVGKMTDSFYAANTMMTIWTIGGLYVVYIHLVRVVRADKLYKQMIVLFVMLFFCGALNPCQNILKSIYEDEMISLGSYHWILCRDAMLQYRSNLIMIRWISPQIVVPWITSLLLMENAKKVKYYVLLILPTILFGSFSFAALFVIAIACCIKALLNRDVTIGDVFSKYNILTGITLGSIFFFYFLGNLQVDKPTNSSFGWQTYPGLYIYIYIVFCICMFGIYAACVWPCQKNNVLWYVNVAILLFLPWCKMGLCNDIVMSGSIPSLFMLMVWVLQLLLKPGENTMLGIRKGIVIVILVIGCWYPAKELKDNIVANTEGSDLLDSYNSMKWYTDRSASDISEDLMYNYYTYDMEDTIFYKYIARDKLEDRVLEDTDDVMYNTGTNGIIYY